ncbi:hypothetical protein C5167_009461 [Papaver somniferum]|uniref:Uncharacterized protein n=1 Tax=Papaver somniferum TaxID=3469 RepID=A0A4Y7JYK8_PAPSO|nr:hypothetical protein C5167_009461 [Papaver somniferum]
MGSNDSVDGVVMASWNEEDEQHPLLLKWRYVVGSEFRDTGGVIRAGGCVVCYQLQLKALLCCACKMEEDGGLDLYAVVNKKCNAGGDADTRRIEKLSCRIELQWMWFVG